jgi:hypothetical protein
MTVTFTNHSNPAAFGVEWTSEESGTRFQLVNPRGTTSLLFGMRAEGNDRWTTTRVVEPSRFGMTTPPRTFAHFREIATAYVES